MSRQAPTSEQAEAEEWFQAIEQALDGSPKAMAWATKKVYGDVWREIRNRSERPTTIPWRNARHHCASWWPTVLRDTPLDEQDFARWLGHSVKTHLNHDRPAGSGTDEIARPFLDAR